MKTITLLLVSLCLGLVCRAADAIEPSWFPHIDGIFAKGEYIDLNTNATEKLYIRYGPITDSGVELERTTNNVVVWRVHVQPLGVEHSKYRHQVNVRIEDDKIVVISIGEQQDMGVRRTVEFHSLKTGELISRRVEKLEHGVNIP